ncbi:MAG: hypothetical protein JOZ65_24150 [Chloroflexi bacterium]|nr:hypothetical protein [Chloroflexota bacterium]
MAASRGLERALAIGAVVAYFAAYYVWFSIDEPLPSARIYAGPAIWRQTEGFMNLSVLLVYFGLIGLSVLSGCASAPRAWASRRVRAVANALCAAVAGLCGVGVLAGAAVIGPLAAPAFSVVLLLVTLTVGVATSLVSITLAWSTSPPNRGWLRTGSTILALVIGLGMLIALVSTTVFGVDLASHGVPIITSPGAVTVYGVAAVPSDGWGYNLQRGPTTGSWLGNLGLSTGLMVLATALFLTALRRSPTRA